MAGIAVFMVRAVPKWNPHKVTALSEAHLDCVLAPVIVWHEISPQVGVGRGRGTTKYHKESLRAALDCSNSKAPMVNPSYR